jgi:hypothetical protein
MSRSNDGADVFGSSSSSSNVPYKGITAARNAPSEAEIERVMEEYVKDYGSAILFKALIAPKDCEIKELTLQLKTFGQPANQPNPKYDAVEIVKGTDLNEIKRKIYDRIRPKEIKKAQNNAEALAEATRQSAFATRAQSLSTAVATRNTEQIQAKQAKAAYNAKIAAINAEEKAKINAQRKVLTTLYQGEYSLMVPEKPGSTVKRPATPEERAAKIEEGLADARDFSARKRAAANEQYKINTGVTTKTQKANTATSTFSTAKADFERLLDETFLAPATMFSKAEKMTIRDGIKRNRATPAIKQAYLNAQKLAAADTTMTTRSPAARLFKGIFYKGGRSRRHKKTHKRSKKSKTRKN